MSKKDQKVNQLVFTALMATMAYVLAKVTKFPIFPAAPFLKLDFGEIPLLLFTSMFSWQDGLFCLLVKETLSFFVSGSNIFGLTADFLICGCFLTAFRLAVRGEGSARRFLPAVAVGTVCRIAVSIPVNLVILRLQYGTPAAGVWAQMIYILPFNAIKCVLNGACFGLLYHRIPYALLRRTAPAGRV